jgi:hypothetical protein
MTISIRFAFAAVAVIAVVIPASATTRTVSTAGNATVELSAQTDPNKDKDKNKKPVRPQRSGAPKSGPPNTGTQSGQTQKQGTSQFQRQRQNTQKTGVQRNGTQSGQSNVNQKSKLTGQKSGAQPLTAQSGAGSANKSVKTFRPRGTRSSSVVVTNNLRGLASGRASRTVVAGHNYSAWRGNGYRIRYHDRWRTFVPLSALAVLMVGSSRYYPYAYISAPEMYCDGRTQDGCMLDWERVETVEGDVIGQCVAYCPWEEY